MQELENQLTFMDILTSLMASRGLKESDIVKATGLPQTTVSSILKGKSKQPRPATLKIFADLFGLSAEQLVSCQSLCMLLANASSGVKPLKWPPLTIPLINWSEVKSWLSGQLERSAIFAWHVNESCKSIKSFALKTKLSMRPGLNYQASILLVDPEGMVEDGLMVLVFLDASEEPSLKILSVDGEKRWLQSLEKDIPAIPYTVEHTLVGPVVEVRFTPDPT